MDAAALARAVDAQASRQVPGVDDMASCLAAQVSDPSHRAVVGPLRATGRCARGNGGGHLLWVDPARGLVISSRWGADVETLLVDVSQAVEPNG